LYSVATFRRKRTAQSSIPDSNRKIRVIYFASSMIHRRYSALKLRPSDGRYFPFGVDLAGRMLSFTATIMRHRIDYSSRVADSSGRCILSDALAVGRVFRYADLVRKSEFPGQPGGLAVNGVGFPTFQLPLASPSIFEEEWGEFGRKFATPFRPVAARLPLLIGTK